MKLISMCFVAMLFMTCVFSCSNKERVRDGLFRGIYEGSNQAQEMKHADKVPQPGKEAPTYDQYKQERKEIVTDHGNDQPQQLEKGQ
jgi:hypothetical protein